MSGAPRGSPGKSGDGERGEYGHLDEQEDTSKATPAVKWSERYAELVEWRRREGHACVPKAAGVLGRWVARQRELKKKQQLQPEREAQLNDVGMIWDTNANQWEMRYAELVQWVTTHNHACVPIAQGVLGAWAAKQRQLHAKGKLSSERYERLSELSFVWDTPANDWNKQFNNLVNWKNLHGHTRVPFNDGILGWWVNTQRQAQRKNKLLETRRERLDTIDFCWNPQQVSRSLTGTKRKVRSSDDSALPYGEQGNDQAMRPLAGPPPGLQPQQPHQQQQQQQQQQSLQHQPQHQQQQQQQHYMPAVSSSGLSYGASRAQHRLSPPGAVEPRASMIGHGGLGSGGLGQPGHGQTGLPPSGHGSMGLGHGGHGHSALHGVSGASGSHYGGGPSGHGQASHAPHLGRAQPMQHPGVLGPSGLATGGHGLGSQGGHGQGTLNQASLPTGLGHPNPGQGAYESHGQGSHGHAGHATGSIGHGAHGVGSHGQGSFGQPGLGQASHGQGGHMSQPGYGLPGAHASGGPGTTQAGTLSHLHSAHVADAGYTTPSPPLFGMGEGQQVPGKRFSGSAAGPPSRSPFSYFPNDPGGGLYEPVHRNQYGIPAVDAVDGASGAAANLGGVGVGGTGTSAVKPFHGGGSSVGGSADGGAAAGSTFGFGVMAPTDGDERVPLQRYNSSAFRTDPLPPMEPYSPPPPPILSGTPPVHPWEKAEPHDVGARLSPLRTASQRPPLPPPVPSPLPPPLHSPLPPPRFLASAPTTGAPATGGVASAGGGGGGGSGRQDRERDRGGLDRDRERTHRGSDLQQAQRPPDIQRNIEGGRAADLARSIELSRNSSLSRLADVSRSGDVPRGGDGSRGGATDPARALDAPRGGVEVARAAEYGSGTFLSRGPHLFPSTTSTFSSHVGATGASSGGGSHLGGAGPPGVGGGTASGEFSGLDLGTAAYMSSATTVTPGPPQLPSPQLTPATIEQTLGPAGGGGVGGGGGGGGVGSVGGLPGGGGGGLPTGGGGGGGGPGGGGPVAGGGGGPGGGHFEFAHWNPQNENVSPPRLAPLQPLPSSLPPLPPAPTGRTDGLPGLTERFGVGRSGGWTGGPPPRD